MNQSNNYGVLLDDPPIVLHFSYYTVCPACKGKARIGKTESDNLIIACDCGKAQTFQNHKLSEVLNQALKKLVESSDRNLEGERMMAKELGG